MYTSNNNNSFFFFISKRNNIEQKSMRDICSYSFTSKIFHLLSQILYLPYRKRNFIEIIASPSLGKTARDERKERIARISPNSKIGLGPQRCAMANDPAAKVSSNPTIANCGGKNPGEWRSPARRTH